jgi:hypothetical protein
MKRKGQSLVETSLILAAFVGLLLGMLEIGQKLFVHETFCERVHQAARWSAMNRYDPAAIRSLVLYGTTSPDAGATPFMGFTASEVVVADPGCPGAQCRVTVAIPREGIQSAESVEYGYRATDGASSKP